ncbi:MAG: HAMP domain-containing histidine kinase, partial [Spirochaetaceae bacterium]|nr:HAMP domain-containing histidine kinase [Spirochaetaceae bacterium]
VESLVRDLSELSRYESPEMVITPKTLSSCSFMDDMRDRFSFLCKQKNIDLVFNSDLFSFTADEHLLQRCVSNIIQNAIQHTEAGGEISIDFFQENGQSLLNIKNTGAILEDDLEHVFNRFYRGDKSRTLGGTGLGLPIVKAIMNLHQGSVSIVNTESGCVCVSLVFPEIFNLP